MALASPWRLRHGLLRSRIGGREAPFLFLPKSHTFWAFEENRRAIARFETTLKQVPEQFQTLKKNSPFLRSYEMP
jgi:hypothetical protein